MKFFALVALLGSVAAIRIGNIDGHALVKRVETHRIQTAFAKRNAQKLMQAKWDDLTKEQKEEMAAWIEDQLSNGDETITWAEMKGAIIGFGKKHGFPAIPEKEWVFIKGTFDQVDANDDGEIDLHEI